MSQTNSRGSLIVGLILIGVGVLFLLGQFLNIRLWEFAWPFAIIAVGALFFIGMVAGGKSTAGLAIPGSIIAMVGLILLYQNLSDRWESWAYAWTLIPMAVGIGLVVQGLWSGQENVRRSGQRLVGTGLVLFLLFGAFFELLIFGSARNNQLLWPLLLIGFGVYLLVTRAGLLRWPNSPRPPEMAVAPPAETPRPTETTPAESEESSAH